MKGAIENYCKVIEIDPEYSEPYNNLGDALSEIGDKKGAITNYRRVI